MTTVIAILAPGAMGSAVGRRLVEHGALVLTSLTGRSAATRDRALTAGMVDAGDERIAGADLILSILPPAQAVALAQRLAPALGRTGQRGIYVDCNAVNVATVQWIAGILAATPARFVDGAIIGAPPRPGTPANRPRIWAACKPSACRPAPSTAPSARLQPSRWPMPASPGKTAPWPGSTRASPSCISGWEPTSGGSSWSSA